MLESNNLHLKVSFTSQVVHKMRERETMNMNDVISFMCKANIEAGWHKSLKVFYFSLIFIILFYLLL